MQNTLKLVFNSDKNKNRMITIYDPIDGLDDSGVNQAMDEILQSQVLDTSDGYITKKKQAYLENRSKQEFNIG